MTTSCWVAAIRGSSASTNSAASATVLFIFQLAAMYGVRGRALMASVPLSRVSLSSRASTPGSFFPSSSSKDAPPPVESQSTLSSRPNLRSAATESPPPITVVPGAAATASATVRVPAANGSISKAPIGPFQSTVPAAGDRLGVALGRARADVEAHPAVRHLDPVALAALGLGVEAPGRAPGRPAGSARNRSPWPAPAPRAASSTPSSSTSESPVAMPWARKKLKHIAPPIRIWSATSRKRSMTPTLSETLAPPRTTTSGRSGDSTTAVSSVTSRSSSSPA